MIETQYVPNKFKIADGRHFAKSIKSPYLGNRFNQSINQWIMNHVFLKWSKQVIQSLQDPLEKCFQALTGQTSRRHVVRQAVPDGRSGEREGPARTVDSFRDGTSRRLVRAQRRQRSPGRLATRTSWLRYDGAVPWVALYTSTAVLNRTLSWARSQWRVMSPSKMWSEWRRP